MKAKIRIILKIKQTKMWSKKKIKITMKTFQKKQKKEQMKAKSLNNRGCRASFLIKKMKEMLNKKIFQKMIKMKHKNIHKKTQMKLLMKTIMMIQVTFMIMVTTNQAKINLKIVVTLSLIFLKPMQMKNMMIRTLFYLKTLIMMMDLSKTQVK